MQENFELMLFEPEISKESFSQYNPSISFELTQSLISLLDKMSRNKNLSISILSNLWNSVLESLGNVDLDKSIKDIFEKLIEIFLNSKNEI